MFLKVSLVYPLNTQWLQHHYVSGTVRGVGGQKVRAHALSRVGLSFGHWISPKWPMKWRLSSIPWNYWEVVVLLSGRSSWRKSSHGGGGMLAPISPWFLDAMRQAASSSVYSCHVRLMTMSLAVTSETVSQNQTFLFSLMTDLRYLSQRHKANMDILYWGGEW